MGLKGKELRVPCKVCGNWYPAWANYCGQCGVHTRTGERKITTFSEQFRMWKEGQAELAEIRRMKEQAAENDD